MLKQLSDVKNPENLIKGERYLTRMGNCKVVLEVIDINPKTKIATMKMIEVEYETNGN